MTVSRTVRATPERPLRRPKAKRADHKASPSISISYGGDNIVNKLTSRSSDNESTDQLEPDHRRKPPTAMMQADEA